MRGISLILCFALIGFTGGKPPPPSEYCYLPCYETSNETVHHTGCLPETSKLSSQRHTRTEIQRRTLDFHNDLRNKFALEYSKMIGGKVGNVMKMEWDEELEELAYLWAKEGKQDKDKCRNTKRFNVSQNFRSGPASLITDDILATWANPNPDSATIPYHLLNTYEERSNATYLLNIVWPTIDRIGCSQVTVTEPFSGERKMSLACNYGPAPLRGTSLWKEIKSSCQEGSHRSSIYAQLCTVFYDGDVPSETEYSSRVDYCSKEYDCTQNGTTEKNTMCAYKHGVSRLCYDLKTTFTKEKGFELLHEHNMYRNRFAGGDASVHLNYFDREGEKIVQRLPMAKNMRLMVWDEELAAMAHRWLVQCRSSERTPHDTCRHLPRLGEVGQNVATEWHLHPIGTLTHFYRHKIHSFGFWLWMVELRFMNATMISQYVRGNHSAASHFSQVMWANTSRIGCSEIYYTDYDKRTKLEHKFTMKLVCNYGPGGNVESAPIYEVGDPKTEACPIGTLRGLNSQYPNLCSTKTEAMKVDKIGLIKIPGRRNGGSRFGLFN